MSRFGHHKIETYVDIFIKQWAEGILLPAGINPARMPILSERVFMCMQQHLDKISDVNLYSICSGLYELLAYYYELLGERGLPADRLYEEILQEVYNNATAFMNQPELTLEEVLRSSSVGPNYTAALRVAKSVIRCSIS